MKKAVFLCLIYFSTYSMEEDHTVVNIPFVNQLRSRSASSTPEDEFLARVALGVHFNAIDPKVGAEIFDIVRQKAKQMRELSSESDGSQDEDNFQRINKILAPLRLRESDSDDHDEFINRVRRKLVKDAKAFQSVNSLISEAIQDYAHKKESIIEHHQQEIDIKEKQKRRAFIVSVISIFVSAGTTIAIAALKA